MKANRQGVATVRIFIFLLFAMLPCHVVAQDSGPGAPAPINPEFVNYINSRELLNNMESASAGEEHSFGYIPEPIVIPSLGREQLPRTMVMNPMPSRYDLRDLGKVTPVRNQGNCGSCWSFATMGSVESNLLPGERWNFSENNLKNNAGWDWGHCDGGNATMATAYLARWGGAISESDDPYNTSSAVSPTALTVRKHIQEVVIIPARSGSLDNDNIKQAIMNYGAMYISYYHNDAYYKSATRGYYYSGSSSSNHAVTIVGWDDDFPSSSFPVSPPGNGAFIIKNSWGTGWGESGYFYISYYDTRLGSNGSYLFKQAAAPANFSRVYQYDPLGATSHYGYSSNTAWFANVFSADADEKLSAAGFYTAVPNSSYEIYIYTNVGTTPRSGIMAGSTAGAIAEAGYHTVQLSSPIALTSGQKFSIVVRLTTPGYNYPVALEYPFSGALSPTAAPGQSFVSGSGSSWSDITAVYNANTNVCLKGFASAATPTVNSTSPASGATGVAVNGQITATFSEAIDPSTINASSFTLSNGVSGAVVYDAQTNTATLIPSGDLAYGTSYTATISTDVASAAGTPMAVAKTWSFTTAQQLSLVVAVNGYGSVNSMPGGIACTTGIPASCTELFPAGAPVTLIAAGVSSPNFLSHFGGWSDGCDKENGAECSVAMNADKNITALFITNQPVRIADGSYYPSLQSAYNGTPASAVAMTAQAVELPSLNFTLDTGKSVQLKGGYDSAYYVNSDGFTTMDGVLTIRTGSLDVENLVIK
jgi:C1A family cysteine protease